MLGNGVATGTTPSTPGYAAMWAFVSAAAAAVRSVDPSHPVGTTVSCLSAGIATHVPAISASAGVDFLGVNDIFGPTLAASVPAQLASAGWAAPWLAAEVGPRFSSSPEAFRLTWNSVVEPPSSVKAADLNASLASLFAAPSCGGTFVVNYGYEFRAGPTWLSMRNGYPYTVNASTTPGTWFPTAAAALGLGAESAVVDAMVMAYSGSWPTNRAPVALLAGIAVAGAFWAPPGAPAPGAVANASSSACLVIGNTYTATLPVRPARAARGVPAEGLAAPKQLTPRDTNTPQVTDPEGSLVSYQWQIIPRQHNPAATYNPPPSPEAVGAIISQNDAAGTVTFTPPVTPGYYSLVAWAFDSGGKFATSMFKVRPAGTRPRPRPAAPTPLSAPPPCPPSSTPPPRGRRSSSPRTRTRTSPTARQAAPPTHPPRTPPSAPPPRWC